MEKNKGWLNERKNVARERMPFSQGSVLIGYCASGK